MLGNYLQKTTSADDIFRCIFILGALRVNKHMGMVTNSVKSDLGAKLACGHCDCFSLFLSISIYCLTSHEHYRQQYFVHSKLQDESL